MSWLKLSSPARYRLPAVAPACGVSTLVAGPTGPLAAAIGLGGVLLVDELHLRHVLGRPVAQARLRMPSSSRRKRTPRAKQQTSINSRSRSGESGAFSLAHSSSILSRMMGSNSSAWRLAAAAVVGRFKGFTMDGRFFPLTEFAPARIAAYAWLLSKQPRRRNPPRRKCPAGRPIRSPPISTIIHDSYLSESQSPD
jgi:hypothetical protein